MTLAVQDTVFSHPWVNQLPADFYRQPAKIKKGFDPAMSVTVGVDLMIRTGLSMVMAGLSVPSGYSGTKLLSLLEQDSPLSSLSDEALFHRPRPAPDLNTIEADRPKGVEGGIFEKLEWKSAYQWKDGAQPSNNDQVVAWYWRHDNTPRPTILLVHGFLAPWWEVNEFYLGIRFLYNLGCDVVLKTLPHHGPRARSAKRISGIGFFSGGVEELNHAVLQSTYDIRTLVDVLQQRGVERIGISGVSLGGYTTALIAGLDNRFEFAMPLVPLVSIPDAMMEWKPLDRVAKTIMGRYGVTMQQLRNTMAFHSPLSRPVQLPADRLLIIAGKGDCLASPRHSETLQQHWGGCQLHWYAGAHALPRQQNQTNQVKQAFLQRIGFVA